MLVFGAANTTTSQASSLQMIVLGSNLEVQFGYTVLLGSCFSLGLPTPGAQLSSAVGQLVASFEASSHTMLLRPVRSISYRLRHEMTR